MAPGTVQTALIRWQSDPPLALRARGGSLRQRTRAVLHRPRSRPLVDPYICPAYTKLMSCRHKITR